MNDPIMEKLLNSSHVGFSKANIRKVVPDIKEELVKFDELKAIEEKAEASYRKLHFLNNLTNGVLFAIIGVIITILIFNYFRAL